MKMPTVPFLFWNLQAIIPSTANPVSKTSTQATMTGEHGEKDRIREENPVVEQWKVNRDSKGGRKCETMNKQSITKSLVGRYMNNKLITLINGSLTKVLCFMNMVLLYYSLKHLHEVQFKYYHSQNAIVCFWK